MKIIVVSFVAVAAFGLGLLTARLLPQQNRTSDLNEAVATFYGPDAQFSRSAATVMFVASGRARDATLLNCRAMHTALGALDLSGSSSAQQARLTLNHLVRQGQCSK